MGTSSKGVIAWTSITDTTTDTPGLTILPGSHLTGLWPGEQTDTGYILGEQEFDTALDIEVNAGKILLRSPYLVHKNKTGHRRCQMEAILIL